MCSKLSLKKIGEKNQDQPNTLLLRPPNTPRIRQRPVINKHPHTLPQSRNQFPQNLDAVLLREPVEDPAEEIDIRNNRLRGKEIMGSKFYATFQVFRDGTHGFWLSHAGCVLDDELKFWVCFCDGEGDVASGSSHLVWVSVFHGFSIMGMALQHLLQKLERSLPEKKSGADEGEGTTHINNRSSILQISPWVPLNSMSQLIPFTSPMSLHSQTIPRRQPLPLLKEIEPHNYFTSVGSTLSLFSQQASSYCKPTKTTKRWKF